MITILLQKILEALTQLLFDIKTKLNTIKDNLDDLIVVATASGPIASFTTTLTRPLLSCIVDIPETVSGTDTVIVTQTGANIWDEEWEQGAYNDTNGAKVDSNTRIRSVNYISVKPEATYYFVEPQSLRVYQYDKNKTYLGYVDVAVGGTRLYTPPSNCCYITFRMGSSVSPVTTYNNDISINYPSTDTEYHAHVTATTKTVSLPETVYGGEVDVIGGNITKSYEAYNLGVLTWSYESDAGYFYSNSITNIKSGSEKCLCESGYTYDAALSVNKTFTVSGSQIRFRDDSYTSTPDFKTAVTGIDFIYELAEADTDSITPEVITAINGVNNIFSDSGNVTVEYLKLYKEA